MKKRVWVMTGFVLAFTMLLIPLGGHGLAPQEKWAARYNGPGNSEDRAQAIAIDKSGNVLVTGFSQGSGTEYDYATIKYSTSGKLLWAKRYDGPGKNADIAQAVAIDGLGNVFVSGYSWGSGTEYDYATIKYSAGGKQLWAKRYNGPGNARDWALAMAVDGSGNVYVTGRSEGSGTGIDYATIKYDTNGKQLWVKRYNGRGNGEDWAWAMAVDGSGNVYVTGDSEGSGSDLDYVTIKYNTNGKQLWVKRYNGPGNDEDAADAVAVDGSGNVYVTGFSLGSGTENDYATIKYDTNGKQLWTQRYDGPAKGEDWASDMAVDGSGNVYVTGTCEGSSTHADFATIKYNTNGKQLWVKKYNGPGKGDDTALAIAVARSGDVYITGPSWGSGTDYDYATLKY